MAVLPFTYHGHRCTTSLAGRVRVLVMTQQPQPHAHVCMRAAAAAAAAVAMRVRSCYHTNSTDRANANAHTKRSSGPSLQRIDTCSAMALVQLWRVCKTHIKEESCVHANMFNGPPGRPTVAASIGQTLLLAYSVSTVHTFGAVLRNLLWHLTGLRI
eukprot:358375-Chlamydomonas_euryale.AAC.20